MPNFISYQSLICLHTVEDPGIVSRVTITPDGQAFVNSSYSEIKLWHTSTGQLLHTLYPTGLARSIAISSDNQLIVAGCDERTTVIWNLHTGEKLHTLYRSTEFTREVRSVVITPDCTTVISGTGAEVDLWDLSTGKLLSPGLDCGAHLALSKDGQTLISSHLSRIKVREFPSHHLLYELESSLDVVNCLAISPDGQHFVIGNQKGFLQLFYTQTAKVLLTFKGHEQSVTTVVFSPDGQTLISCGRDRLIKFWNWHTGEQLHVLDRYPWSVDSIALSADGRTLVSCSGRPSLAKDQNSLIKVWQVSY